MGRKRTGQSDSKGKEKKALNHNPEGSLTLNKDVILTQVSQFSTKLYNCLFQQSEGVNRNKMSRGGEVSPAPGLVCHFTALKLILKNAGKTTA